MSYLSEIIEIFNKLDNESQLHILVLARTAFVAETSVKRAMEVRMNGEVDRNS